MTEVTSQPKGSRYGFVWSVPSLKPRLGWRKRIGGGAVLVIAPFFIFDPADCATGPALGEVRSKPLPLFIANYPLTDA